jgi:REP element-mobilizing transposase RayT
MARRNPPIIAHHLILTGYGHWLPNDPRGSGSSEMRQGKFADLGPIHFGRKAVQPNRDVLRTFQRTAQPRLAHSILWFDEAMRDTLGDAVGSVVREQGYTCWACGILKNHLHLCIRKHRADAKTMLEKLDVATREALRGLPDVPADHPIWAERPYKRFLFTPEDVRRVIAYIERNPVKEGLERQAWPFVVPYDGWPFHKRRGR